MFVDSISELNLDIEANAVAFENPEKDAFGIVVQDENGNQEVVAVVNREEIQRGGLFGTLKKIIDFTTFAGSIVIVAVSTTVDIGVPTDIQSGLITYVVGRFSLFLGKSIFNAIRR